MLTNPPLSVCVYDTGIFLQAALNSKGPAARIFALLEAGLIILYISPRLRHEIEDVLYRPALRTKYPRLTDQIVTGILDRLDSLARMVPNAPLHFALPRDRKDEPILNLAIHIRADYLVSRDRDLLDLNQDAIFKAAYPFLSVLDPAAFYAAVSTATTPTAPPQTPLPTQP